MRFVKNRWLIDDHARPDGRSAELRLAGFRMVPGFARTFISAVAVAGWRGELFQDPDDAYKMLYTYTKGLPRDAIKICFELFIELAVEGTKTASSKHIEEIAKGQNLRA